MALIQLILMCNCQDDCEAAEMEAGETRKNFEKYQRDKENEHKELQSTIEKLKWNPNLMLLGLITGLRSEKELSEKILTERIQEQAQIIHSLEKEAECMRKVLLAHSIPTGKKIHDCYRIGIQITNDDVDARLPQDSSEKRSLSDVLGNIQVQKKGFFCFLIIMMV